MRASGYLSFPNYCNVCCNEVEAHTNKVKQEKYYSVDCLFYTCNTCKASYVGTFCTSTILFDEEDSDDLPNM